MPESPFSPSNQCFGINKIDRSNVFNCPSSSASLSTAKVFTATTNIITKPSLSIPGRDSIKQSVKTRTSLVGGKFKIKQWKITKANGAIFSDTNRSFKIRLASLLQQDVNWGKWSEKEENLHINFLELIAAKFAIPTFTKEQSNIAIHLQIDNKTALSYLLKMGGYTQHRALERQQVHLELPSQQTNCNVCRVPSQCSKCTCRLGITKCQGQFRMETRCFSFPRDCNTHETTSSASVCIQALPPTSLINCM